MNAIANSWTNQQAISVIRIPKELTQTTITDSEVFFLNRYGVSLSDIFEEVITLVIDIGIRSGLMVTSVYNADVVIPRIDMMDHFEGVEEMLQNSVEHGTMDSLMASRELNDFVSKAEWTILGFYKLLYNVIMMEASMVVQKHPGYSVQEPYIRQVDSRDYHDHYWLAFEWILVPTPVSISF